MFGIGELKKRIERLEYRDAMRDRNNATIQCPNCNGRGYFEHPANWPLPTRDIPFYRTRCSRCEGIGKIRDRRKPQPKTESECK